MTNKPKTQIRTTGELREFLVNMMTGVKDGDLPVDKASQITKLAGQVNESIYAEIKATRLAIDAKREYGEMGTMDIGVMDVA